MSEGYPEIPSEGPNPVARRPGKEGGKGPPEKEAELCIMNVWITLFGLGT